MKETQGESWTYEQSTISDKNYGKNCYLGIFIFLPLPPLKGGERKDEVLFMLFQVTTICFNEPDYITLQSIMNIMTENGAKMTHKMPQ